MQKIELRTWCVALLIVAYAIASSALVEEVWAQTAIATPVSTPTSAQNGAPTGSVEVSAPVALGSGAAAAIAFGLAGYTQYQLRRGRRSIVAAQLDTGTLEMLIARYESEDFRKLRARAARDLLAHTSTSPEFNRSAALEEVLAYFQTFERLLRSRTLDEDLTLLFISGNVLNWGLAADGYIESQKRKSPSNALRPIVPWRGFNDLRTRIMRSRGTEYVSGPDPGVPVSGADPGVSVSGADPGVPVSGPDPGVPDFLASERELIPDDRPI